jgi:hypothetical protein
LENGFIAHIITRLIRVFSKPMCRRVGELFPEEELLGRELRARSERQSQQWQEIKRAGPVPFGSHVAIISFPPYRNAKCAQTWWNRILAEYRYARPTIDVPHGCPSRKRHPTTFSLQD